MKTTKLQWIWPGFIAKGKVHLIAGRTGVGSSMVATSLAAAISSGGALPDKTNAAKGKVLISNSIGIGTDDVVSRLSEAGSNLHNIQLIDSWDSFKRYEDYVKNIPEIISNIVLANRKVSTVILDTFLDYRTPKENRKFTQRIKEVAEKLDIAIIGVYRIPTDFPCIPFKNFDRVTDIRRIHKSFPVELICTINDCDKDEEKKFMWATSGEINHKFFFNVISEDNTRRVGRAVWNRNLSLKRNKKYKVGKIYQREIEGDGI